jgi:hypothetical protein
MQRELWREQNHDKTGMPWTLYMKARTGYYHIRTGREWSSFFVHFRCLIEQFEPSFNALYIMPAYLLNENHAWTLSLQLQNYSLRS